MTGMRLSPAVRYRFADLARTAAIFYGIMVLILGGMTYVVFYMADSGAQVSGSFSAFGVSAAITMFVAGICSVREDLRLMLQNGVGRKTVFVSELLAAAAISLILAAAGELLIFVGQFIAPDRWDLFITDLFQLLFFYEMGERLTLGAHLASILCFSTLFFFTHLSGIFLSLMFYRLNKLWTIVVAVGAPVLLFVALPILLAWRGTPGFLIRGVKAVVSFAAGTPQAMALTLLGSAAVMGLLNWLLMRRASVKPAK